MRWLYIFIPISFVLGEMENVSPAFVFFISALAIIPIASLIAESTEQIAFRTGDAVGGILNATFGNAPELIISIVALRAGQNDIVAASIIGAILANLLLAQGVSFLAGGLKYHDQTYNPNAIRIYCSLMLVAVTSLAVPSVLHKPLLLKDAGATTFTLNVSISVLLILMYCLYLVFVLHTHPEFLAAKSSDQPHGEEHSAKWSVKRSVISLIGASILAAFLSEVLVGSAEGAGNVLGMSKAFIGLICVAVVGGAAESISAITMGAKNRMDLSIGISLGSSIQIALFVAPILVLLSYFIAPTPFLLVFNTQLLFFLLLSVLVGVLVAGDGHGNWYKGVQLIILYLILATALYLLPA